MAFGWVVRLLEESLHARSDSPALMGEISSLSYAALQQRIDADGMRLQSLGTPPDARLATILPDGPDHAILLLSISNFACAVPLNPSWPVADLRDAIARTRASAVVVPADSRHAVEEFGVPRIESIPVGGRSARDSHLSARGPIPWISTGSPAAVVLLTSGSTAKPKVVPLTAENLTASARATARTFRLAPSDLRLNLSPLFHVSGLVHGLLAPLVSGGAVAPMPGYNTGRVYEWMERFRPTWFSVVPSFLRAMLQDRAALRSAIRSSSLRFARVGAAPISTELLTEAEEAFGVPFLHAYGMTETASQIACNPLPPGIRRPGSVGLPQGPQVTILDPAGSPVPKGLEGEICVRGPNVFAGYEGEPTPRWNDWFRTGDLGRFDDDGYLFVTGRLGEVINRRGELVSPLAVEEALLLNEAVAEAAAFPVPLPDGSEDLHAAVVLRPGRSETEQSIRSTLAARTAASRIPTRIAIVDRIPRGPTGKIQRKELGRLITPTLSSSLPSPPQTDTERAVAAIWEQVLGKQNIPADADYFQLGGDSIMASRIAARIEAASGIRLSMSDLYDCPTVRKMAARIEALRRAAPCG